MPESKTVTGHTVAMVKLAKPEGAEVAVHRGEKLPDGLADGELARLESNGTFDEPAKADLAGQGARPAFAAVPEVQQITTDALPPRGAELPLPPQVTLAANPEPDGGVAKVTETTEGGERRSPRK